jgi:hypothetical protein
MLQIVGWVGWGAKIVIPMSEALRAADKKKFSSWNCSFHYTKTLTT